LIQHDQNCPTFTQTFEAHRSYLRKFAKQLIEDIAVLKSHDIVNYVHSEVGAESSYMVT
ncbi:5413_t:CDS:1, partial [Cetraspora pellucida]